MRKHNFGAGPGILPESALKKYYLKKSMEFESTIPEIRENRAAEQARKLRTREYSLEAAAALREIEIEVKK